MKRLGKNSCVWSLAMLSAFAANCKSESDDNIFEITTAVSYTAIYYGTSSNKFYSAENGLKAMQFAQINWSNLMANMAGGQGEHLSAMADLMGIKPAQKTAFYRMTKSKFNLLFPSTETTPEQLVNGLNIEIAKLDK